MIEIAINILAVIGALTVASAIIVIAAIIIPEVWQGKRGGNGYKVRAKCSLNDEYCPHDDEDNFLDCEECEVYEEYKKIGDR